MADARDHVLSALESLLRAAAEGVAALREAPARGWGTQLAAALSRWVEGAEGPTLAALRDLLRAEVERWDARAAADPEAARVAEIFRAALEALEPEPARERPEAGPRARPRGDRKPAPRRAKGV